MAKYSITKYELGGIRNIEVRLPGYPAVTVARDDDGLTEAELVKRAEAYWAYEGKIRVASQTLISKYGYGGIVSHLPQPDIDTTLEGEFVYVLKPRKQRGKYQILEAIKISGGKQ